jgi:hypothetical protein
MSLPSMFVLAGGNRDYATPAASPPPTGLPTPGAPAEIGSPVLLLRVTLKAA